ncbi:MAG: non-ribosomal peptide synthetase [Sulfurifustis sp.]
MSAQEILDIVAERGLKLSLDGANLRLEGPQTKIDAALVGRIRAAKAELVQRLRAATANRSTGGGEVRRGVDLTPMQATYFYGRQDLFAMGGVASHVYHEIEGTFDLVKLENALGKVIERHGMLRMTFTDDAVQTEHPASEVLPVRIAVADLRNHSASDQEAARLSTRAAMSHQVLPADKAPLIDVRLTVLGDSSMVLHVSHDGLIMDGVSSFLFFDAWHRAYAEPGSAGEPLKVSFSDYVAALASLRDSSEYRRARMYWMNCLDAIPPHPQLPLRQQPTKMNAPASVRRTITLDPREWSALKAAAASRHLTPNAVLISAYAEALSLWGAGDKFTLNVTVANRLPIHPDIDRVIGNFTDCLLLPIAPDPDADFGARASVIQTRLREALDHRHFSGIDVMREIGRCAGSGQAAPMPFTFNSTLGGACDGTPIAAWGREVYSVSQTPQVWVNVFVFEAGGALTIAFDSLEDLFPERLIEDLVGGYECLLHALAGEDRAWRRTDHALLPSHQVARRREANQTAAPIPAGQIFSAFLRQAAATPDALAIATSVRQISYRQLRAGAFAVARRLRDHGVQRNDLVAIVMHKGWEQIVAILGTVIAGAAYVPIEASFPKARLRELTAQGNVRIAIVQEALAAMAGVATEMLVVNEAFLDAACRREAATGLEEIAPAGADQDDLAYVIYTSGSTGTPKGVMVSHRSVVNLVADTNRRFGIGSADRFFSISSCSFDLSVFDIFGALSAGAALVIPDADRTADPEHWLDLATRAGASVWNSVPAIVGMMVEHASSANVALPPTLRLVMMSGDHISVPLVDRLFGLKPDAQVISLGGPTETTVWNILYPIEKSDTSRPAIPYGKPNANNRCYILDAQMRECPDHVPGILYAAGDGLAKGYWSDPEYTARRFLYQERLKERLYNTGDVCRYLPDGNIEILGRADFQIKLNGLRIDPSEIETILGAAPGVSSAAVVCWSSAEVPKLVACVVAADGSSGNKEAEKLLIEALGARLPDYMVPRQFAWFDRFPLTENGKVDRAALVRALDQRPSAPAGEAAPSGADTELERRLTGFWSDVLKADSVDPTSNFYDLGGTSLLGARLLARIRKELGVSVPFAELRRLDSPRKMAVHIERVTSQAKAS